jgi:ankyrin repeat protein
MGNYKEREFVDFLNEYTRGNLKKIHDIIIKNPDLVNKKNSLGETLLQIFASNGDLDMVKYLHQHGADLDTSDNCCSSPLSDAVSASNKDIVEFLLENGADINKSYEMGNSILHKAVDNGNINVINLLMDYGADIFKKNDLGETILHLSIENPKLNNLSKLLIKKGLSLKNKNIFGHTPLDIAILEGNTEMVDYINNITENHSM